MGKFIYMLVVVIISLLLGVLLLEMTLQIATIYALLMYLVIEKVFED